MAAEALERSVLESKDKEQLFAIAQALGIRTSARAAKATLIDRILESTGVTSRGAAEPAPARSEGAEEREERQEAARPARAASRAVSSRRGAPAAPPTAAAQPAAPAEEAPASAATADATPTAPQLPLETRPAARSVPDVPDVTDVTETREDDAEAAEGEDADGDVSDGADGDGGDGGDEDGATVDGESRTSRRRRRRRNKNRGEAPAPEAGAARPEGRPDQPAAAARPSTPAREVEPEHFPLDPVPVAGYLDLREEGYGFLRVNGFVASRDDAYVPVKLTRQLGLRKGDHLTGTSRPAGRNEKNPAMIEVHTVNGAAPDDARERRRFEDLTPVHADQPLRLAGDGAAAADEGEVGLTARVIDLVAPIGRGQRALIVAPPRAGATTLVTSIAAALERHQPDVDLTVVLIDARPEDVTEVRRSLGSEVVASTFDRPHEEHVHLADLVVERAKRVVEQGRDAVLVVDGLTRLARAHQLSGAARNGHGVDGSGVQAAKRLFGAARRAEEGGTLTIIATAVADPSGREDAIIEDLEAGANVDLRLDRGLAERRVFPAIDVARSGAVREDLLPADQAGALRRLREQLTSEPVAADGEAGSPVERLLARVTATRSNADLLAGLDARARG